MNTINWGIIGCGDVCEVKSGPAFQKVPHSSLTAVMRRNGNLAADFARRHGVGHWYTDAQALIDDPKVNAVYIATPPSLHEAYALAAIAAGKPVYVEKPMAHTAASAARIAAAAHTAGVKLCVAHYRREQPLFLHIKSLLAAGAIGKVAKVELRYTAPATAFNLADEKVQWRLNPEISGGGFFHDLAPHQLDLLFYFLGAPDNVKGIATDTGGHYKAADAVSASLLFPQQVLATCSWFFAAPDNIQEDFCVITGARGTLLFPVFGPPWLEQTIDNKKTRINFAPLPHVQEPMIAAVTQHFLGLAPNPCPADAGVLVMNCMEVIALGNR